MNCPIHSTEQMRTGIAMKRRPGEIAWKRITTALCLIATIICSAWGGEHWPSYRGPTDQGYSSATNLPIRWSESENVVWKTAIDGKAWSSPVIWGDQIWITSAPLEGNRLFAICVDKNSGKLVHKRRLHHVVLPQYCHPFNSYASPSPVIEAGRVYVSFGSPYNACLDSKTGEVLWERTDFVCNHFRGAGSSPFIYKNLLILHFDGSDRQYVVGLDKRTGKTRWKTDRSVDFQDLDPQSGKPRLQGDLRKAYSTPVIADVAGKPVLISLGSMALYGYEPETGKELWRLDQIGSHSGACRPVVGHGLFFVPMGSGRELWAVRPGRRGKVADSQVVWKHKRSVPRRPSILLVDDLIFMVDDGGVAACVEAKTGREVWTKRLGGNFSASPIYADGRIYFFDQEGQATVIEAARQYKVVAVNQLDEGFMASPAVSGQALFLRSRTHLYRVEDKSQSGP
jgi:outer membrane protein assembly factor BamB